MIPSFLLPPPLPPWDGIHPVLVNFPIALLLISPLFVLLGLLPKIRPRFAWAALVLLVLGTIAAYVAEDAGEDAAELVVQTPEIAKVLDQHANLGESVPIIYTVLTGLYALVLIGPALLKRVKLLKQDLPRRVPLVAQIVVLVALLVSSMVLANTGELGGRLVHEFGVRAWMGGAQ